MGDEHVVERLLADGLSVDRDRHPVDPRGLDPAGERPLERIAEVRPVGAGPEPEGIGRVGIDPQDRRVLEIPRGGEERAVASERDHEIVAASGRDRAAGDGIEVDPAPRQVGGHLAQRAAVLGVGADEPVAVGGIEVGHALHAGVRFEERLLVDDQHLHTIWPSRIFTLPSAKE